MVLCKKLWAGLFSSILLAQGTNAIGLGDLEPEKKVEPPVEQVQGEVKSENAGEAAPVLERSEISSMLANKLRIFTSLGWVTAKRDSIDWRAKGMGDFGVIYKTNFEVLGGAIWASGRYAPFSVAPSIKAGSAHEEYLGSVEQYFLGAKYFYSLPYNLVASGQAELGLAFTHLYDELALANKQKYKKNKGTGIMMSFGGGLDYPVMESFTAGAKLDLGFGTYTSIQFSAAFSFAF